MINMRSRILLDYMQKPQVFTDLYIDMARLAGATSDAYKRVTSKQPLSPHLRWEVVVEPVQMWSEQAVPI